MSFVNFSTKEIHLKILYFGAGLGGKTTNMQYIFYSQQNQKDLEIFNSENERTLFFDFLPVSYEPYKDYKMILNLYTIPGQNINQELRDLVFQGLDGVIFVVDSQKKQFKENEKSFHELKEIIQKELLDIPIVVQFNKRDLKDIYSVLKLKKGLMLEEYPQIEAIANKGSGVFETLNSMVNIIKENIRM
jgi:signal recognition particle receptor subunit beta